MTSRGNPVEPDRKYYRNQRVEMLPFIPQDARDFLEIGCGEGTFGGLLQQRIDGASVTGVEAHPDAAREARKHLAVVIESPIEAALASIPDSSLDCVVCNDVLEHLVDPWAVLGQLRSKLRSGGSVVSSIPNVRHFPVFKSYFLAGDWKYEEEGVLDRTHLRFFTRRSIQRMYEESGYRINRIEGIFGYRLPWKAAVLNRLLGGRMGDMQYERFAAVATPLSSDD
jgi:2-polyprenyl-3-methyl-5-hydroxy-6-metoxy-1,4-benzoquinol methylase